MSYDRSYQRTTTNRNNRRNGRYLPPPPPPPSGGQRHHSLLGYWVPLITIGTIAVGGLAAWVWSEREHDDDYPNEKPSRPPTGAGGPPQGPVSQPYSGSGAPPGAFPPPSGSQQGMPPPVGGEAASYYQSSASQTRDVTDSTQRDDNTFLSRMSGVMRRTPSPQQFFDQASRQVSAGVAAAGAAAGAALSSIMEEDKRDEHMYESEGRHDDRYERREEREGFSDHERWSEEVEEKSRADAGSSRREDKGEGRSKRIVAVVLSGEVDSKNAHEEEASYHIEHGSILSHLPNQHDPSRADLFVLIYSSTLQSLPPINYEPSNRAPSTLGSYSQISTPAVTPGSELASISPRISASDRSHFDALYTQALALVSHPSHILPFTTPDGYVSMLRHLAPQTAYVSDTLSGHEGETVAELKGWVGHTVLVVGDDGHGGLADTETETEDERSGKDRKASQWRWYEHSNMVGLGKEVEVVDAARVGDDWSKRVVGRE